jgi:cytochrome c-type biogenesis protein CcmH
MRVLHSIAFAIALAGPAAVLAQAPARAAAIAGTPADSVLDARTRELAAQLRCPVCQGLSLQDSPSELSQQMREVVRQQLAAGKTPAQVKEYFVARYGEWILMEPEAHGFNWAVYVLPYLALAAGGWGLFVAFRRWTAASAASGERPSDSGEAPSIL